MLQAPLHNLRKIKESGNWLNTKPQNGQLAFGSDNPFCGLTSVPGLLTFLTDYSEVAFLTCRSPLFRLSMPYLRPFSTLLLSAVIPTNLKATKAVEKGSQSRKIRLCSFCLKFDFRDGKESSREVCIVYAPLERRRHLERVFCALMYRYAATEWKRVR